MRSGKFKLKKLIYIRGPEDPFIIKMQASKELDLKSKATHYILTYHCDEQYDWERALRAAFDTEKYRCVSGQLERGKNNGKIHLQAYLGTKTQVRGAQLIKDFPGGAWFKRPNKWQTDKANIGFRMHTYCTKADTRVSATFLVLGEPPEYLDQSANGKRGREKQKDQFSAVLDLAKRGLWQELQELYPDHYVKHHTTLKRIHQEDKTVESYEFPHPLRDWQRRCLELLDKPDDRTIVWFTDLPGAAGKTTFLKWLAARPTSFYLDGGKKQDNIFLLKEHHTLLLVDLPRHARDYVPYSTMETFKNGLWTSTKYEGNRVHRKVPGSVIVVANFYPDVTKLSMDRWDIYLINKQFKCEDIRASDLVPDL